jgi:hypothetical protein
MVGWLVAGGDIDRHLRAERDLGCGMPGVARPDELTAAQLSERAAGYVALAKDTESGEARETFRRLATVYAGLAAERKAAGNLPTRHCGNARE